MTVLNFAEISRQMFGEHASERAAIVAWLRARDVDWQAAVKTYQKLGNWGPYLGGPSYYSMASAIERGDHLSNPSEK